MTPVFHPQAVNGAFGDPVVYVDFLYQRRALLFDLGDIERLPARKALRISHVFVSHTHVDHFIGFDRLLRLRVGRPYDLHLAGPPGLIDQVGHKLAAYTWNLVDNYPADFAITVTDYHADGHMHNVRYRCKQRFAPVELPSAYTADGVLLNEDGLRVRTVVLDHKIPCLAYALEEKIHVNIWKNRLDQLGLPTGAWLRDLKALVRGDAPDTSPLTIRWRDHGVWRERDIALGELKRNVLSLAPGQKIAYVVDAVYNDQNAQHIVDLARACDVLYIEAAFTDADGDRAAQRYHLTARQAGSLARAAAASKVVALHHSARYGDDDQQLIHELTQGYLQADQPVHTAGTQ